MLSGTGLGRRPRDDVSTVSDYIDFDETEMATDSSVAHTIDDVPLTMSIGDVFPEKSVEV